MKFKNIIYISIIFIASCTNNYYQNCPECDSITFIDSMIYDTIQINDELLAWVDSIYDDFQVKKDSFINHVDSVNKYAEQVNEFKHSANEWILKKSIKLDSIYLFKDSILNNSFKNELIKKGWVLEDSTHGYKFGIFLWDSLDHPVVIK